MTTEAGGVAVAGRRASEEEDVTPGHVHFVAGTLAGVASVFVGYPFDTVKVRMQTQSRKRMSSWGVTVHTYRQGGLKAFYRGMATPLIGDSVSNSAIFGVYGVVTGAMADVHVNANGDVPLPGVYAAGMCAGFAAGVILTPIELVKVRLQVQQGKHKRVERYTGPRDVIMQTFRQEGIRGLFTGLASTLARDVPGFGAYFISYEGIRRVVAKGMGCTVSDISPLWSLGAGAVGGIMAWLVTYPFDVVKSRLQTQSRTSPQYAGIVDCVRTLYSQRGLQVFFAGIETTIIRAVPVNAVLFTVYELVQVFFADD